jgi:hypothetical protein
MMVIDASLARNGMASRRTGRWRLDSVAPEADCIVEPSASWAFDGVAG